MKFHKLILLFITLLLSSGSLALSTDREQPITIEANNANIDNIKRVAIYQGKVIITQGSIRINAEKVTLNYSPQREIETVVAIGKPVHFQQRLDNGEYIKAKANNMKYNAIKNMLHLKFDARLRKEKNGIDTYTSQAPRITYDTQRGIFTAYQGPDQKGRTTMTFNPQPKR